MENTLLWALAFLGVVVIYTSKFILKIFGNNEPTEMSLLMAKSSGIFMSIIAILILFITGRLV